MIHFDGDNIDQPTNPIETSFIRNMNDNFSQMNTRNTASTKLNNEQSHHHLEELLIIIAVLLVIIAFYFLINY